MAAPTAGSVVGDDASKMNARSLREPSPLMSEPTSGVNGAPDATRPVAVTSRPRLIGQVSEPVIECRRSNELTARSRMLGFPAVVAAPKLPPPPAPPPRPNPPPSPPNDPPDDWSSAQPNVYPTLKMAPRVVSPCSDMVSCFAVDVRSDPTEKTCANAGSTRDASTFVTPLAGTIVDAGTNTGRFPSFVRVNCGVVFRLRSVYPVWAMPRV